MPWTWKPADLLAAQVPELAGALDGVGDSIVAYCKTCGEMWVVRIQGGLDKNEGVER